MLGFCEVCLKRAHEVVLDSGHPITYPGRTWTKRSLICKSTNIANIPFTARIGIGEGEKETIAGRGKSV